MKNFDFDVKNILDQENLISINGLIIDPNRIEFISRIKAREIVNFLDYDFECKYGFKIFMKGRENGVIFENSHKHLLFDFYEEISKREYDPNALEYYGGYGLDGNLIHYTAKDKKDLVEFEEKYREKTINEITDIKNKIVNIWKKTKNNCKIIEINFDVNITII